MEDDITPDMSINDIIRKYPDTMGVFNRFNVDSCCGGARSLKVVAGEDKIDLEELIKALRERV
jgi:iron-sulfur cluster repair protein YtfE (RIC family)